MIEAGVLTGEGLLPMVDGPVSAAVATMLADERQAAGDRPTAMGTRLRGSMAEIVVFPPDLDFELLAAERDRKAMAQPNPPGCRIIPSPAQLVAS